MTPRSEAIAFRIWAHCREIEWNATAGEVARAIGECPKSVGAVLRSKGWHERLRVGRSGRRMGGPPKGIAAPYGDERAKLLRDLTGRGDGISFGEVGE